MELTEILMVVLSVAVSIIVGIGGWFASRFSSKLDSLDERDHELDKKLSILIARDEGFQERVMEKLSELKEWQDQTKLNIDKFYDMNENIKRPTG